MTGRDALVCLLSSALLIFARNSQLLSPMGRKGRELSLEKKQLIIQLSSEKKTPTEIGKLLDVPRRTVGSVIKKNHQTGSVENKPRSGRRKLFTDRDVNALDRIVKSNRKAGLRDITGIFNDTKEHSFSQSTIKRKLSFLGYKRRAAKKHVAIRDENRKKRVTWCRERRNWTVDEQWKKYIFSDESQIVIGTNNRVYIWRQDREVESPYLTVSVPPIKQEGLCYDMGMYLF